MKTSLGLIFVLAAFFAAATQAAAAPPINDTRFGAPLITVPQNSSGTTVDATVEETEPSTCGFDETDNSVWYQIVGNGKRVAIGLDADGDLDAVIDVYNYSRSKPQTVDCDETNSRGIAVVGFRAKAGTTYFIRVAEQRKSASGTFKISFLAGSEPARKPGKRLSRRGVTDGVNMASNPSDTWSIKMRAGTPYLIHLSASDSPGCPKATLYAPGESLEGSGSDRVSCNNGFTVYTPGPGRGGRYTIAVESSVRTLGTQRYRLTAGSARRDDIAPGSYWRGNSRRGHLNGVGIDWRDLYNFDLDKYAYVNLRVASNADFYVRLRSVGGRSLACSCDGSINRKLRPGTYFAEVRAEDGERGKYTLKRTIREITKTTTTFNGARYSLASDGASASLAAAVTPAGRGRLEIILERKDPAFGWMFVKRWRSSGASGGRTISWTPPGVGEYRAKSTFSGSRNFNPSRSGWARLSVRR